MARFWKRTLYHEFGHLLSAPDHYGYPEPSTSDYNWQYPDAEFNFNRVCIYGEVVRDNDYPEYAELIESRTVCSGCRELIENYLTANL